MHVLIPFSGYVLCVRKCDLILPFSWGSFWCCADGGMKWIRRFNDSLEFASWWLQLYDKSKNRSELKWWWYTAISNVVLYFRIMSTGSTVNITENVVWKEIWLTELSAWHIASSLHQASCFPFHKKVPSLFGCTFTVFEEGLLETLWSKIIMAPSKQM